MEGNALKRISLQNWDWAVNFNSVTLKAEKIMLAEEKLRSNKKEKGISYFSHHGKITQDCPGWKEHSDASVSSSYRNQNQRRKRQKEVMRKKKLSQKSESTISRWKSKVLEHKKLDKPGKKGHTEGKVAFIFSNDLKVSMNKYYTEKKGNNPKLHKTKDSVAHSESKIAEFQSEPTLLITVWPWASHPTSICFSFLTCKIRIITIPFRTLVRIKCNLNCKALSSVYGTQQALYKSESSPSFSIIMTLIVSLPFLFLF